MKKWIHKIEKIVDTVIPYCLFALLIILILELGFDTFINNKGLIIIIDIVDYIIVLIFVSDLIFKYIRVHNIPKFLRNYWIEIIAIFPFFLTFRLTELAFGIRGIRGGITAQSLASTGASVERSIRLARFIKPLERFPRFIRTLPQMLHFYNKPTGEHHPHEVEFINNKE